MDSNTIKDEEFLSDPEKLHQYFNYHIEEIGQTLDNDEKYCDKDIDSTLEYIDEVEKKFHDNIQNIKVKLQQLRIENGEISERNRTKFNKELQEISELFSRRKYNEALNKFKNYEKIFQQRLRVNEKVPKLHIHEFDIDQYFSSDYKPNNNNNNKVPVIQSAPIKTPVIQSIINNNDNKEDFKDEININSKEYLRQKKCIENITIDNDNEDLINDEKNEQTVDISSFGNRSRPVEKQQTTIDKTIRNDIKSPIKPVALPPKISFSTRLKPNTNNKNLPSSHHITSVDQPTQNSSVNNYERKQIIPPSPRPNSVHSLTQQQIFSTNNSGNEDLILNPVSHYQHEQNIFLLMACDTYNILLFKSQCKRLDRWHLGVIKRRTHTERMLDWHDGLIISMGHIEKDSYYMFTEREFFIYSINKCQRILSRILPHGDDNGPEINNLPYIESHRGIGTVYGEYMYHIYLNGRCRWTLSKNLLDKVAHLYDYDLTNMFPDVDRFIHLCINDKTINFLVQLHDTSYAVVFCSTNDCKIINELKLPVHLSNTRQPLTISSGFIQYLNEYIFFINDPSNDILHILNTREYLYPYSVTAHAMCYVKERRELMIVTKNSICSINLNEQNLFFSKIFSH